MICHQYKKKVAAREADSVGLFCQWWTSIDVDISKAKCREISIGTAANVIRQYEYLGTMANAPMFAYGVYWEQSCGGVVVIGSPSPPNISRSAFGNLPGVLQLARGASTHWAHKHSSSLLIGFALRDLGSKGYRAVIAFSDPDAGEIGTVYQATNWLYCGMTASRPDYVLNGKRMVGHFKVTKDMIKTKRTRKHRYVHLLGDKRKRKEAYKALRWPVIDKYPKRELDSSP